MGAREELLRTIRGVTEALPEREPLPPREAVAVLRSRLVPESNRADDLQAAFLKRWQEASGVVLADAEALAAFLEKEGVTRGYADPAALAALGVDSLPGAETAYDRADVDALQFGVTMGVTAIAETGTVALNDRTTTNRLAALAPWVHVAVVRKQDVVSSLADGVARFDDDPSIVFVTGPSKTADIEGILIEGVHGPGRQAVVLV